MARQREKAMPDELLVPPVSIEAERAVLGGLMLAPDRLAEVSGWLGEDDFYPRHHRMIFRAIRDLASRPNAAVDAVTMAEWFDSNGLANLLDGGSTYLIEIANETPSAANILAYAEIVAEKARLRRLIDAGTRITSRAYGQDAAELVVGDALRELSAMNVSQVRGGLDPVGPMLRDWFQALSVRYEEGEQITGLSTGFRDLDNLLLGLQPGEVTIIAGRPNMGKSILGAQLALHAAVKLRKRTSLFSMEMTKRQVLNRAVACLGRASYRWIRKPDPSQEDPWPRVTNALALLKDSSDYLLIDDSPGLSLEKIQARARRAHLHAPIELLVVDHLHEMPVRAEFETSERGEHLGGLKALGKEFNCPVVVLAQLSRANTNRPDKRPTMSDLRASGELEQKADVILFVHREDYYDKDTYLKGAVEVIVGKGRDVPTGETVLLVNRFNQMRMEDWDDLPPTPPQEPERSGGFRRRSA